MTLNEKVHYEYERFYLDMMRTSKENIFAHGKCGTYEADLKQKNVFLKQKHN